MQKSQARVFVKVVLSSTPPVSVSCNFQHLAELYPNAHSPHLLVASMGAATPQIAYTASKGAVLAMTREMAMVHAREGIRINALSP